MGDQTYLDRLTLIDTWEVAQFAYIAEQLAATPELDGTVLDNSVLYFSSEIEDGNAHRHGNLPVLLAGRACGTITPGRHLVYNGDPMANLFLAILQRMGVDINTFGDNGNAPLSGLS